MSDDKNGPHLEAALDGLIIATEYAENAGLSKLSERIAMCYGKLGAMAPKEDWQDLPTRPEPIACPLERVWDPEIDEE